MRLATGRDELVPLRDDRVRENPAYLTVVLLARVITRLGSIDDVHAGSWRTSSPPISPSCRTFTVGSTRRGTPGRGDLPVLPARVHRRRRRGAPGGIVTYATDRLHEEVAYIAFHFHWSLEDLLDLEHPDRQRYVEEIGRINERMKRRR